MNPYTTTNIYGNAQFTNSTIILSTSSILNISGCLDLKNSTILIKEANTGNNFEMVMGPNCPNINLDNIKFIPNGDICSEISVVTTRYATKFIVSLDTDSSNCSNEPLPYWLIGLICLIGVIIISIAIIFAIFSSKRGRERVIPFRDRGKFLNE